MQENKLIYFVTNFHGKWVLLINSLAFFSDLRKQTTQEYFSSKQSEIVIFHCFEYFML